MYHLPIFRDVTQALPHMFRGHRLRPLALGLQASSQKKMRALFVIHSGSRPKRSWELEEVYDHVGEMVRRQAGRNIHKGQGETPTLCMA
jgi:hypothetical protein